MRASERNRDGVKGLLWYEGHCCGVKGFVAVPPDQPVRSGLGRWSLTDRQAIPFLSTASQLLQDEVMAVSSAP